MQFNRREMLFGLLGLSLPFVSASCTQSPQATGTAAGSISGGSGPAKIRIGYQLYAGSELLAKGLGLAKQTFANSELS